MTKSINCPGCGNTLPLPDGPPGRRIRCPDCFQVFFDDGKASSAPAKPPRAAAAAPPPREAVATKSDRPTKTRPAAPKEEVVEAEAIEVAEVIEDAAPRRPARRPRDEDEAGEEERRPARRGRNDEGEEEERPRQPAKKGGGGVFLVLLLLFGVGGLLLALVAGGGFAAYWFLIRAEPHQFAGGPNNQGFPVVKDGGEKEPKNLDKDRDPNKDRDKDPNKDKLPNKDKDRDKEGGKVVDNKDKDKDPNKDKLPNKDKDKDKEGGKVIDNKDKEKGKDKDKGKQPPPGRTVAEKALPESIGGVALAGGGRYLLLHQPKRRKIAVYDVTTNEIARELPVAADKILFAGGLEKVAVFLLDTNVLIRYDLASGDREQTTPADEAQARTMAMGHASRGPIMLAGKFYDLETLKPYEAQLNRLFDYRECSHVRASADGATFAGWKDGSSPQGVFVANFNPSAPRSFSVYDTAGHLAPTADGQYLYTARGVYTRMAKAIGDGGKQTAPVTVPSAQGCYYFALNKRDRFEEGQPEVSLYSQGNDRALLKVTGVAWPTLDAWPTRTNGPIGLDQRIIHLPELKKLVILPKSDDRILSYPLDPDEEMNRANVDYLYLATRPPARADLGKDYAFKVDARSSKGGVKVKLDEAPEGMKLDGDAVSWKVPADYAQTTANVILSVSDAGGQELLLRYGIVVNDETKVVKVPPFKDKFPKKDKDKGKDPLDVKKGALGKLLWDVPPPKTDVKVPSVTRTTVNLKAPVTNVVPGGGGRFLVMFSPKDKRVSVFDVNKLAVVKALTVDDENVKIAASADRMVIATPRTGMLQVYSLNTFELEKSAQAPLKGGTIQDLAMGWSSSGPLMIWARKDGIRREDAFALVNPATLKAVDADTQEALNERLGRQLVRSLAPSGDGRSFVLRSTFALHVVSRQGDRLMLRSINNDERHLEYAMLNHDGSLIMTNSGIRDLTTEAADARDAGSATVAALQGPFYANVPNKSTYLVGQGKAVLPMPTWAPAELVGIDSKNPTNPVPMNKRINMLPAARTLVFLTGTNSQLVVLRYDPYGAAEKLPYLYVASHPQDVVKAGGDFEYKVAIRSKRGGVKVALVEGPKDMKVSEEGTVSWKVPAADLGKDVAVKLSLTDAGNQEIHHAFVLCVRAVAMPMKKED